MENLTTSYAPYKYIGIFESDLTSRLELIKMNRKIPTPCSLDKKYLKTDFCNKASISKVWLPVYRYTYHKSFFCFHHLLFFFRENFGLAFCQGGGIFVLSDGED